MALKQIKFTKLNSNLNRSAMELNNKYKHIYFDDVYMA